MVHDLGYVITQNSLPLYLIKGNIGSLPADSRSIFTWTDRNSSAFSLKVKQTETSKKNLSYLFFKLLIVKSSVE